MARNKSDKQRLNPSSVNIIIREQFKIINNLSLNPVAFKDLFAIIDYNKIYNEACNSSYLLRDVNYSGSTYFSLYSRLNTLINKGLVMNVSDTDRYKLIPTEKAIKEFEKLFSCLDE